MSEEAQNLSVSEAAALLASRRVQNQPEPEAATPAPARAPQELPPEEEHPVEDSDLEEGEVGAEEGEVEYEEEEVEAEESVEDDPEAEAEPAAYTLEDDSVVVIDGEEITGAELKKRGLREQDYTQKTQALAAQRQAIQKREQLVAARLGQQQSAIQARMQQFQNVDWPRLAQEAPEQYQAARAQMEALQLQNQQIEAEAQHFFSQIAEAEQAAQKEAARHAASELKRTIPGWNNALYYSLVDYAADQGFQRDEVLKYTDPRIFALLNKAKAFDEAQKVGTKKVVKAAPQRTVTTKAPTGRRAPPKEAADLGRAKQKLQKSGSMDDAVALLQARRRNQARKQGR